MNPGSFYRPVVKDKGNKSHRRTCEMLVVMLGQELPESWTQERVPTGHLPFAMVSFPQLPLSNSKAKKKKKKLKMNSQTPQYQIKMNCNLAIASNHILVLSASKTTWAILINSKMKSREPTKRDRIRKKNHSNVQGVAIIFPVKERWRKFNSIFSNLHVSHKELCSS